MQATENGVNSMSVPASGGVVDEVGEEIRGQLTDRVHEQTTSELTHCARVVNFREHNLRKEKMPNNQQHPNDNT